MENAFEVLRERGFVQQVTDEDAVREMFGTGPVTAYIGFDATASSLHVGNLFVLMTLVHLEHLGHKPIVVLGGGTTMVGDPSGKTEMRKMLERGDIDVNINSFRTQVGRFLDIEGGKTQVVDNAEWLLDLKYVEFLRDIGRHFSVNRMLAAEAYKQRLERGLSFIEFNYQLLQAYDFLQLCQRYKCTLQMGGDDQWGNIVAGIDLCRRVAQTQVHGLTFPLLLNAAGQKMGKTVSGAVWLDAKRFGPYDYYQYWVNMHDDDVERMLGYFTFLPMEEVRTVSTLQGADLNAAKSVLAYEATVFVHGEAAANEAHSAAQAAFGSRALPEQVLPSSKIPRGGSADAAQIPTTNLSLAALDEGVLLTELLTNTALASSKNEARRLIRQNAIKLNDRKPEDEKYRVTIADFVDGRLTLRAGKKKVHRVVLE
ncbi:MAG: tyrosine--tRNA ligase [Deltaproteobacteria bacterium RIFOXYA12_FULL_58_15]|nr:MAG: tyrosine--tRNA ligase [Deltaproteobacteria bacterium RIFOXYA12_FULL_58_15]OGR07592.1 MAG: tyrosine--tRNA ligase [Deltaproteobacteria bacterium RIFOXYB12_FULL_58_9]